MSARVLACALAGGLALAAGVPDELARLAGHAVTVAPDGSYTITDVAGAGRPRVGIVERDADGTLWLAPAGQDAGRPRARLAGPLAVPRLLAPGYKVWLVPRTGTAPDAPVLRPVRFGVLARPRSAPPPTPLPGSLEPR